MNAPPEEAIRRALEVATMSPCAKSKRGVVAYHENRKFPGEVGVFAEGFNGPPDDEICDDSEACRINCAKRCVHAEARAIRSALVRRVQTLPIHLVHVKVYGGELVAGGGPSCWQCSREILDAGIAGIWLYQEGVLGSAIGLTGAGASCVGNAWLYYDAREFHRATKQACEIGGP